MTKYAAVQKGQLTPSYLSVTWEMIGAMAGSAMLTRALLQGLFSDEFQEQGEPLHAAHMQ